MTIHHSVWTVRINFDDGEIVAICENGDYAHRWVRDECARIRDTYGPEHQGTFLEDYIVRERSLDVPPPEPPDPRIDAMLEAIKANNGPDQWAPNLFWGWADGDVLRKLCVGLLGVIDGMQPSATTWEADARPVVSKVRSIGN